MTSAVTNLRRQFVQRRLWPVAILLVAALAAVPLALAKDPAPAPPAPPVPVTHSDATDELAAQPIVTQAGAPGKRRKVLGNAKNPFGVAKQDAAPNPTTDNPVVNVQNTGNDDGSGTGGSSPSSGSGTTPSTGTTTPSTPVAPATPAPAPKTYASQELTVRFGATDGLERKSVKRLQPLPSAELPVLIYMGVSKDGKSAIFLVDQGVTPVGDGECKPTPEECETIRLREGETEFLDVTDDTGAAAQQYQLDLIKIHKSSSASASSAKASHANAKSASRRSELRSVAGRVSAYLP
jgi:hypothetical protein